MPMRFFTIEEVLAHKFVGDHASDMEAFDAIERFMTLPATSREDRRRALYHVQSAGMGIDDPITDEVLDDYMNEALDRD